MKGLHIFKDLAAYMGKPNETVSIFFEEQKLSIDKKLLMKLILKNEVES